MRDSETISRVRFVLSGPDGRIGEESCALLRYAEINWDPLHSPLLKPLMGEDPGAVMMGEQLAVTKQSTPSKRTPGEAEVVGNRITGRRITVWDIVYYLERAKSEEAIAQILRLSLEQVRAAVQYIGEHREDVMATHRRIEERIRRGNPPEVQAKLARSHERFLERLEAIRRARVPEGDDARDSCRQ